MSSLVYKVHAQVLFLCSYASLISREALAFVYVETSLVVLQPGRPPAFELRKRYLYPSQNQPPFGDWREANPRISLSYNYYILVPFMNAADQIVAPVGIEM